MNLEIINKIKHESNLKEGQSLAYDKFFNFFFKEKRKKMFVISGIAGTGKTTLLSKISECLEKINVDFVVATYTGKASSVLIDKGATSQTIHSLMYKPIINDSNGNIIGWKRNEEIPYDLIIIDEFSMLSKKMIKDLLFYGVKILFLGDINQLPSPEEDTNYLEDKIDVSLAEILRQAKDNPIIENSIKALKGFYFKEGFIARNEQGVFMTVDRYDYDKLEKLMNRIDVMICGTNKFRHFLNTKYREIKKIKEILAPNDNLVILKNNEGFNVFNGQIATIYSYGDIFKNEIGMRCIEAKTSLGDLLLSYDIIEKQDYDYNKEISLKYKTIKRIEGFVEPVFTNYAHALTCHKMQGSQARSIMVFSNDLLFMRYNKDKGELLYKRALYTAITRAEVNCVLVV